MRLLRKLRQRVRSLVAGAAADDELRREIDFHLEALTRENMAAGMNAAEARLAARRGLGNSTWLAEQCRDERRVRWLTDIHRDMLYAWRTLAKSPGFLTVAIAALALGVSGSIAVFTLGEAILLRSLPFPEAERLVALSSVHVRRGESGIGQEDFRDWQAWNTVFERMTFTESSQMTLAGNREPERITGRTVAPGFFEMLGVQPALGRWFTPAEQQPHRDPVVILSHGFWERKLGARPEVIGTPIVLNEKPYRITGIMPKGFRFNEGSIAEYWTPISYVNYGRLNHQYPGYGRLKRGVTLATAQREMTAIARRLERAYPDSNSGWGIRVVSMRSSLLGDLGPALLIFSVAVSILLLIACGNVASLLLARGIGRAREIAIRVALGSGRARVVRLLLTESLLLASLGAAAGLVLAALLVRAAIYAAPAWLELGAAVSISPALVGFTIGLTLVTGLITGAWPAIKGTRGAPEQDLKEGGTSLVAGRKHERALHLLVVGEIALATVLLSFAGLLVKSFTRLVHSDMGFRTERILTFRTALPSSRYKKEEAAAQFYERLLARLVSVPGVVSAGAIDALPMGNSYSSTEVEIQGHANSRDWADRSSGDRIVTTDFFRTLGVPLRAGRMFDGNDRGGAEPVAMVNETFARKLLPGEDPVGKYVRIGSAGAWKRIVGVVADYRHNGPADKLRPEMFLPFAQEQFVQYVAVRTAIPEDRLARAVRDAVRSEDAGVAAVDLRSMRAALEEKTSLPRTMMILVTGFAAVALGMATLGVTGVMAYAVSRRRREIGLRLALGAGPGGIAATVARTAARLIAAGAIAGVAVAMAATRILESSLFGVAPRDPAALVAAPALLAAVALLACTLPAHAAARVDPMTALRQD